MFTVCNTHGAISQLAGIMQSFIAANLQWAAHSLAENHNQCSFNAKGLQAEEWGWGAIWFDEKRRNKEKGTKPSF